MFKPFGKDRGEIRVPNLGWVRMREPLRIDGRVLGAVVSRDAGGWSVSISCEGPDHKQAHPTPATVVGIDRGMTSLMVLSRPLRDGRTVIENPKPLRKRMKTIKRLSRRISRQEDVRKKRKAKTSRRLKRRRAVLAKVHWHAATIRRDTIHKATTALCENFETAVLEDLNVAGLVNNHTLAGAIHDAGLGEIRRQIEYKQRDRGGYVTIADRFLPVARRVQSAAAS